MSTLFITRPDLPASQELLTARRQGGRLVGTLKRGHSTICTFVISPSQERCIARGERIAIRDTDVITLHGAGGTRVREAEQLSHAPRKVSLAALKDSKRTHGIPGRIGRTGMGGFLNPPGHPEHEWHVAETRGGRWAGSSSLSSAAVGNDYQPAVRAEAKALLKNWKKPSPSSPEFKRWVHEVLDYYRGMYRDPRPGDPHNRKHDPERDPLACNLHDECRDNASFPNMGRNCTYSSRFKSAGQHAGVHHIRRWYPLYMPTEADFANAKWGLSPRRRSR